MSRPHIPGLREEGDVVDVTEFARSRAVAKRYSLPQRIQALIALPVVLLALAVLLLAAVLGGTIVQDELTRRFKKA